MASTNVRTGTMLGSVLVAWNGSQRSRAALDWALQRPSTTSVRLLRALGDGAAANDIERGSAQLLDAAVAQLRAHRPDLTVVGELIHDDVEPALLARSRPGSLLVLGCGGPASRFLPRRSAMLERLAEQSNGPIVLVPPSGGDPAGPVIAGVDDSAAGAAAARVAAAEASADARSVVALHVRPGSTAPEGWPGGTLDSLAHELEARFPQLLVRERFVRGDVHRELAAATAIASLLVLGRHGRPGPGSATIQDALVRAAAPLMLVRASDAPWPAQTNESAAVS